MYDTVILNNHIFMSTLSVPLTGEQEKFIKEMVSKGYGNKAAVVRRAIDKLAEDEAVNVVLESEKEVGEGKIFRGDLRKLLRKSK